MLYILHGLDSHASYRCLRDILTSYKDWQKVYLDSTDELDHNLFGQDLLETPKVIIVQNFFKTKPDAKKFAPIPVGRILIIWEKTEIPALKLVPFAKIAKIQTFKLPPTLFYFLDSISPGQTASLHHLKNLEETETSIVWHLTNRIFLLILAKLDFSTAEVAQTTGKNQAPWQWAKIKEQADRFNLDNLRQMLTAALKVDDLTKSGKTSLPQNTILSLMLIRYLKLKT